MDLDSFTLAASLTELEQEPLARDDADAVEFRMDLATTPRDAIRNYAGSLPVIATNRIESEGGEAADSTDRYATLSYALEQTAVTAIDIELSALEESTHAQELADTARETDTTVIVSSHDFTETPSKQELEAKLNASFHWGDVAKLSVTANEFGDVLTLLNITWAYASNNYPIATMSMGEIGRHSRVLTPLYGSKIGYAPISTGGATAPGQFELAELRNLITTLHPAHV